MEVATRSLVAKGWTVEDVSGERRGYDLLATRRDEELHVESKGTTAGGASVLVTPGEVAYAREHSQRMQLSIVSGIELRQADDDSWVASGGTERRIRPWHPDDSVLEPVGYEWLVPPW